MQRERLIIPPPKAAEEADKIAAEAVELQERVKEQVEKAKSRSIPISVSKKRGRIRRNGPCPCGSLVKFKNCCAEQVRMGHLSNIRLDGTIRKAIPMRYQPPASIIKKIKAQIRIERKAKAKKTDE